MVYFLNSVLNIAAKKGSAKIKFVSVNIFKIFFTSKLNNHFLTCAKYFLSKFGYPVVLAKFVNNSDISKLKYIFQITYLKYGTYGTKIKLYSYTHAG